MASPQGFISCGVGYSLFIVVLLGFDEFYQVLAFPQVNSCHSSKIARSDGEVLVSLSFNLT